MKSLGIVDARAPRIGPAFAVFLPPSGGNSASLVTEFEAYCTREAPNLKWWRDSDDDTWRAVTPELLAYPRRRLLDQRRRKTSGYVAYVHGGADGSDPHPFTGSLSLREPGLDEVQGVLEMWKDDAFEPSELLARVLSVAALLQPVQGYGGLAVAPYAARSVGQDSRELQYALARRYEGLEVQAAWFTKNAKLGSLAVVQWLTIVSDTLLSPLGGRAALADLPDGVVLHDYGSGVVIQAGAAPDPGDVNKPDTLGLYRAVARKLAPIRIREPLPLNVEMPRSLGREETREWYRRLERER